MTISAISVPDMHCSACSSRIRQALTALTGIQAMWVNPARRQILVEHAPELAPLEILSTIETAGFQPALSGAEVHDETQRALLKRLGIAGLAMMQVMMAAIALYAGALDSMGEAYRRLLEFTSLLFCIPVVAYCAMPFFSGALRALRTGVNMDVPIALAIAIAFSASLFATLTGEGEVYYDSVVMFTFLLLGARYVESRLRLQFAGTGNVLAALPRHATRLHRDRRERLDVEQVQAGDALWVGEGEQIPVDGVLDDDGATTDEAVLTGESRWVAKMPGDPLWAGSINRGAGFAMTAAAACDRSRLADIATLADRAQLEAAPAARFADAIARVFIPTVLILATATYVIWQLIDPDRALVTAITVLVVSCPCALSLATPAALTAAMTRLRRRGIVLTRGNALESAAEVSHALLDKTGTLTIHQPRLQRVTVLDEAFTEALCLALAAALQQRSAHPYASAFAGLQAAPVEHVETVAGRGVRGRWQQRAVTMGRADFCGAADSGDGGVFLAVDGKPVAAFELSDEVRSDAAGAVRALQALQVQPEMLSGDAPERCAALAAQLEIPYLARQTPESKLARLRELRASGVRVLMLGDGVNDVPVLAGADVSAAVVEASDLVKSKADVLLLGRGIAPLAELVRTARRTVRITRQNLLWALAYNLVAIPVAALGLMPPWLAALGMASSSILVMFNATRLLED